ncbi:YiiX/YebB-like N1pC/P60 family cysteine hydrolase [Rubritalea tangerina]|uniref:YiiX/YebB-like N1pC/P60 family cysteine hydrolase n=1 Tax=Rubritalea tangerina TaxID=430798 RepID=A0ABW4ZEH9_9BACT
MKRALFPIVIALSAILSFGYAEYSTHNPYALQDGDIVFQSGHRGQANAIKAATNSEWTHVGVVFKKHDQWWVLEAVQPVKFTKLEDFIKRHPKSFHARRLKDTSSINAASLSRAEQWAKQNIRKDYDLKFLWDDKKLYCSELVWKVYKHAADVELCEKRPMKSYNLEHPTVASLIKQRYGDLNNLPLDSPVVAPSDIAESELLVEVPKK